MKRTVQFWVAMATLMCAGAVHAADPLKDTLSLIPADAMAFVAVPSAAQLDADYQQAVTNLGLQDMVPPPMKSLVGMMKMYAPMLAGVDENGPMAVVIMPAANVFELQMKQALILSAKEPKALLEGMGGQPAEGDLYTVPFFGQTMQGAIAKNRVVLGMAPDVVKAIKDGTASIDSKLSTNDVKVFDGLDLIVWLDAARIVTITRPMIDSMLIPMMNMQAGQGGLGATSAEMNKQNLELFLNGINTVTLGLKLDAAGLDLRGAGTAKSGTELAKRSKVKTTTEPLLRGLPSAQYLLTFGQNVDPAAVSSAVDDLKGLLAAGAESEKLDKEKVAKLEKALTDMVGAISNVRGMIEGMAPGPDGLLGITLLVETADSSKWIAASKEAFAVAKEVIAAKLTGDAAPDADEAKVVMDAITYADSGEKIGGVDISHLKVDVNKIAESQDADEEDLENAKKILGKEGVLFRVGAVDEKQVMVTFGGGEPRTAKVVEAAKSTGAPLHDEAGIKKVSAHLPKERSTVLFIAVDRVIHTIQSAQRVLEEEVLPLNLAPLHAPIGISETGGDGWMQLDFFVPTDLLVAAKTAGMSLMGSGQPAGEPEPQDEPEAKNEDHE